MLVSALFIMPHYAICNNYTISDKMHELTSTTTVGSLVFLRVRLGQGYGLIIKTVTCPSATTISADSVGASGPEHPSGKNTWVLSTRRNMLTFCSFSMETLGCYAPMHFVNCSKTPLSPEALFHCLSSNCTKCHLTADSARTR